MSMTCDHNSQSDSPVKSAELHHSAADTDTMEQMLVKDDDVCCRNLQNVLNNKDDRDAQSETSISTVYNHQLDTNAGTFNFLPTDTICGQIEISDSTGNHIGTKIVASSLTVINNNTSATHPAPKKNESTTIQTTSILTTFHCSKLIILSSIIMAGLTVVKYYDFNTLGDKKREILPSSNPTELSILTTLEPKLPDPWIVSRAQWGATTPQTTCHGYNQAVGVAIGETKTNTCGSIPACSKIIRQIQTNKMMNLNESKCDIDYNFLIGYDSRIYEGLAWDAAKLYDINTVVKIAFIGDYSNTGRNDTLTDTQVFSLLKFLEKSQNENHFKRSYTITAECCSDNVKSPGDNILFSMISWKMSNLAFACIIYNKHRSCNHLFHYYHQYHLDKYKHNGNY